MFTNLRRFALLLAFAPSLAYAAPAIHLTDLVLTPSVGVNGVAFLTVTSTADDAITGARSNCCTAVELHNHEMDGDIMRMRRVGNVPLKAGVPVAFGPGGLHVMLIGLKKPIKAGDKLDVTLTFKTAPPQVAHFIAAPLHDGAQSPMQGM